MGFRSAHANEALDYSIDKTSALDWLCKFLKANAKRFDLLTG
jgi:hypothetical protein